MTTPAFRFSHLLTVQPEDIDELDHANNVQYVRWVQDTAAAHWHTAYPPADGHSNIWVVREHRIRYHYPALLGEQLRCTTWIGEVRGAQSASCASSGQKMANCSAKPRRSGCCWTRKPSARCA
jgi:acyl-CoA thioester hydrolase